MENIGDWLYIVFLVVAVVSSLFSSKKKKARPAEVPGRSEEEAATDEEAPKEKSFWEILEEMQKERPEAEADPVFAPKSQPVLKSRPTLKPQPVPFLTAELSITDSIAAQTSDRTFWAEEEKSVLDDCDFHNLSELKKAVIYTEIFNRKY